MREHAPGQFDVIWVKSRAETIESLAEGRFEAVLLDLCLPDSLGLETLWALNPNSVDAAIIVLTGSADEESSSRAIQSGAEDYLVKGAFNGLDLVHAIRHAVERRRIRLALQDTIRELERKTKELEDFTYSVSHDLKEPLRTLGAFSAFLLEDYRDQLDERGKEYLETLTQASSRMKSLVEDLLLLSRLRQMEPERVPVDLEEVLNRVLQGLQITIEERDALVIVEGPLPDVVGDGTRVGQILANLIANALKFNQKRHPTVRLGQRLMPDGEVALYVADNGIGIEAQYQDRVFGVFQRLHTREEYEGTGAGLAIAKHAVESMGGRIWVESELGKGATFLFTLPVVRADALSMAA
jgi:light-regulated signal transduction histidine kinase (bacteriophytochrome)